MAGSAQEPETNGTPRRVAIITGGTRGIGLAIARALAADGVAVTVTYRADLAGADLAREQLAAIDAETQVVGSDNADLAACQALADQVGERWGRIDILVNNAGVSEFAFLEDLTAEFFTRVMQTNLTGAIFLTKAAVPWMKRNRFGRVLNASSISGHFADVGQIAYGCSKAGIEMFTRLAAAELAPYGITVNAYAPGIIRTEMTRSMIEDRGDVQVKQVPAGLFGEPQQVAALLHFLCSPEAAYITGEVIGVDGGMFKAQNPQRGPGR